MNNVKNDWFINCGKKKSILDLYCFHHAGGAASYFYNWKKSLPEDINLITVQLPGRENRIMQPFATDVHAIAHDIANNINGNDNPFIFFGHSLGGLIAFEVARKLRFLKFKMPEILFISAHKAPDLPFKSKNLLALPDGDFIKKISEIYGGFSQNILECEDLISFILPRLRSDFSLCENYVYTFEPPLDVPIIAFGALNDKAVTTEELLLWQHHTTSVFDFFPFQEDHFYLNKEVNNVLSIILKITEKHLRIE